MVGVDDNVIYFWFLNNLKRLSALGVFHVMRYIKCMILMVVTPVFDIATYTNTNMRQFYILLPLVV